jgi:hypothetical protein
MLPAAKSFGRKMHWVNGGLKADWCIAVGIAVGFVEPCGIYLRQLSTLIYHLKLLKSTGSPQFTSCFQTGSLICLMHHVVPLHLSLPLSVALCR